MRAGDGGGEQDEHGHQGDRPGLVGERVVGQAVDHALDQLEVFDGVLVHCNRRCPNRAPARRMPAL